MKLQMRFGTLLVLALAAIFVAAPAAFGQSTTGSIAGTVTDAEGSTALPGAIVTAVHEPTGTKYNSVTRNDGRFSIRNVRVGGPYTVTVDMDGFSPYEVTGVFVQLGDEVDVRVPLQLEAVEEVVTVVADYSPLINSSRTGAASNVSTELLESLPTVDRNFNSFARTNPFMTVAGDGEDPEAISVAGRNSRYNNISIDGAVNNDLFGLADTGTPGGQSGTTPISLDALEQLELVIADFDVRNGGFSGGSINAVTRSGSNDWKGSVFYFTRDNDFVGDGPEQLGEFGEFEEDQYGFRLGGPIKQDKIFFFVNADIEEGTSPSGWSLDGSSGQCWNDCESIADAQELRQFMIDTYGYDIGGLSEVSSENPSDKYFARLDFNIGDTHQLTARHNYVDAADVINRPGGFTYEWPSEAYAFQDETNSTVFQLNSALSSTMFNEARVSYQTIRDQRGPANGIDFPWIEIESFNGGEWEFGTEAFSSKNSLDQDIFEIHDDLTWIKGDHTITIGTHNELFSFKNVFIPNAFGAYQFSGLDNFYAGNVRQFNYTILPPDVNEADEFDVNQFGFYVGDQWAVRSNLTVNLGLRVDVPFFPDEPRDNPFTRETYGFATSDIPDGEQLWQPRVGFNWDPGSDGKSQLRGGVGVFAGRTPYVWISNNYARHGLGYVQIQCTGGSAPAFSADPNNQPADCAGLPDDRGTAGEFNLIDPDFQFPQVLRFNLAYDYQLPIWGLVASVEGIYADSLEEIDYRDVNIRPSGQTTFDGRILYEQVDPNVTGAYLITNTNDGKAKNVAVKLEKPFSKGFWGYVSYAWSDAEVVNDGTSSQASSNWRFNEAIDPNNASVSRSDFNVEHRYSASLSYRFNRATDYATTVSLFYNHQSGRPFSWLMGSDFGAFNFGRAYNGDGQDGNDLLYVPANEGDVVIVGGGTWAELDAYISRFPHLNASRGGLVERNGENGPWSHTLDLHLDQDIPVGFGKVQVTLDIVNLMNLFDDDSGTLRYVNFSAHEILEVEGITDDGRPIVSFRNSLSGFSDLYNTHNINSRWRAKLGLRWSF